MAIEINRERNELIIRIETLEPEETYSRLCEALTHVLEENPSIVMRDDFAMLLRSMLLDEEQLMRALVTKR